MQIQVQRTASLGPALPCNHPQLVRPGRPWDFALSKTKVSRVGCLPDVLPEPLTFSTAYVPASPT